MFTTHPRKEKFFIREMLKYKYSGYKYRALFCMLKSKDIEKGIKIVTKNVDYIY